MRFPPVPGILALPPRSRGSAAEAYAAQCLSMAGLRIVGQNLRFPFGEIDLLALDDQVLVFVEVRWRSSMAYGGPQASVTRAKQHRLHLAAQAVLKQRPWQHSPQFHGPPQVQQGHPPPCRWDAVWATPQATLWQRALPVFAEG